MANQLIHFTNLQADTSRAAPRSYYGVRNTTFLKALHQREEVAQEALNSSIIPLRDCLFIKKRTRFQRVKFEDILWVQAQGNYALIQTSSESFVNCLKLWQVARMLCKEMFVRVHRSYIVNLAYITALEGNMLYIDTHRIPIGKTYREAVLKHFHMVH
ncbi:MAG: LytR/AlgR family response regulator transcription factor [Thermonemataceae bacterium]